MLQLPLQMPVDARFGQNCSEMAEDWLEPFLKPITLKRTSMVSDPTGNLLL